MQSSETGKLGSDVLETMPDEELEQLIEQAQVILGQRVQSQIEQFRRIARRAGFEISVSRIGEAGEHRRARGAPGTKEPGQSIVAAKYRNPDKPSETWSGRGREPRWLAEKTSAGRRREEFAI